MSHASLYEFLEARERISGPGQALGQHPSVRITASEIVGICRDCGRDIVGSHESMKCRSCRTSNEEWTDYVDCY